MDNFLIMQQLVAIDRSQNNSELRASVQTLLRIIGSYTCSERVYIYDFDESAGVFRNSYEWCNGDAEPRFDSLNFISPSDIPYVIGTFERGDSVIIDNLEDVLNIMPSEYRLLKLHNIHSEIAFPIFFKNDLKGFIGIDNPHIEESRDFLTLLGVVGGHLGNVREALRMKELLEQHNHSLEQSLSSIEKDQKILSILSTDYISVYSVDLNADTLEPLKLESIANVTRISTMRANGSNSYSSLIKTYYDNFVIKSSTPDFLHMFSADYIKEQLSVHSRLSFRYQVTPNSAGQEYFEAEIFPFDLESGYKVIVAFKNIDSLVNYEQTSRRQLQDALDEANLNNEIISAISKIYFSIYRIDLLQDMYEEISSGFDTHRLTGRMGRASAKFRENAHRFVAPEYQARVMEFLNLSTLQERLHTEDTIDIDYLATDGNWHSSRFIAKKRDDAGHVISVLYVTSLINEQKRREQNWRLIAEKSISASEAKSALLSKMSHDIKTPAEAIINLSGIAQQSIDSPEKISDTLKKIAVSGTYIKQLVNSVMDTANLDDGHMKVCNCEISISDIFRTMEYIFDKELLKDNIHIAFNCHDILYEYVMTDGLKLKQICANILSSALIFAVSGDTITLDMYEEIIDTPNHIRLNICLSNLRGAGLGLSGSKDLIDLMGGVVDISTAAGEDSDNGRGANTSVLKVSFDMPFIVKDDFWADTQKSDTEMSSICSGMNLLVAEDNDLNFEVIRELLSMSGMSCERAENGAVCVDKFSSSAPGTYNGILMELQLPVKDGIEAAHTIRHLTHPDAASIPIIAITAGIFTRDIERCRLAGMNDYLTKPLNIRRLINILNHFKKI